MKLPFGKRGLLAALAVTGAVTYWRIRQSHQRQEADWAEDVFAASDEGVAAARAALRDEHSEDR